MAVHPNQYFKELTTELTKRLEIRLTNKEIEDVIKVLPEFPKLIPYKTIWQIGPGKHQPCIHEISPDATKGIPIMNSSTGKTAKFQFDKKENAQKIMEKINSELGKYGYSAEIKDEYVFVRTSEFTSVSQILAKQGLVPLFCEHGEDTEVVFFAEPYGLNRYNLKQAFEEAEEKFYKKFGTKLILPKNRKRIKCRNVKLPDFNTYNPNFMEFIIKYRPNEQQLKTYIALYRLAEIGIPIHFINKRDLVRLVEKYTKMSKRTVQNHLVENKPTLQNKLVDEIYSYSKTDIAIRLRAKNIQDEVIDILNPDKSGLKKSLEYASSEFVDHISSSLPEYLTNKKTTKSRHKITNGR